MTTGNFGTVSNKLSSTGRNKEQFAFDKRGLVDVTDVIDFVVIDKGIHDNRSTWPNHECIACVLGMNVSSLQHELSGHGGIDPEELDDVENIGLLQLTNLLPQQLELSQGHSRDLVFQILEFRIDRIWWHGFVDCVQQLISM